MLTSDGLTRGQFMPLWRDAMVRAVAPRERCRLVLEMGRVGAKEDGHAEPLLVAMSGQREQPLTLLPLLDLPSSASAPQVRSGVEARLAEIGATEVYLLATLQGPKGALLLTSWGETLDGEEHCHMLAYRKRGDRIEEAQALIVPEPALTQLSRQCRGLLAARH
jgi:hypothetical protein